MLFWSHFFDLVAQLFGLAVAVAIMVFFEEFEWGFVLGLGAGFAAWFYVFRPLSAWMYARLSLKTQLTWQNAKAATTLFSPSIWSGMEWHPMKEVRYLPDEERSIAIMRKVSMVREMRKRKWQGWISSGWLKKAHTAASIAVVFVAAAFSFAHLPPASWISELQMRLFREDSYSPLLTTLLCALPFSLILKWLDPGHVDCEPDTKITRVVNGKPLPLEDGLTNANDEHRISEEQPSTDKRSGVEKYGPPGSA